ncbi:MAG: hypothetical protein IJL52_11805 [Clostridia bacterium]|nr:hypothetical protein [Clostridia bacterium]
MYREFTQLHRSRPDGKMISADRFAFRHNLSKDSQNYAKGGEAIGEN